MAMFEFKDSEDIKIKDSSTSSDKFFSGDNVKRLTAENCQARGETLTPNTGEKSSLIRKARDWFVEHAIAASCAALVTGLVAYFQLFKA